MTVMSEVHDKETVLTAKITADAKAKAAALIKQAEEAAEAQLSKTREAVETRRENALAEARAQAEELIKHRLSLAELEIKRQSLGARRAAVDKAFDEAVKRMYELKPDEYLAIVSRMIKKHGRDGDAVLRGKGDEKRITAQAVADISKALKVNLRLSDSTGDFRGGVKLLGKESDKNLTFESLFRLMREGLEAEIAQILFK